MNLLAALFAFLRALVFGAAHVAVENLAMRHQLGVYQRSVPRPKLRCRDRIFWVWLRYLWSGWRSALHIVSPDTVVHWHRMGFQLYWRWRSRGTPGRPPITAEIRKLIHRLSTENPLWGAPHIRAELHLLGHDVAEATVAKYLVRSPRPPSQNWRTFLENHVGCMASIDFFQVPTATFNILYGFLVLSHEGRRLVHFNVTTNPTAEWVERQIMQAFPFDTAPCYLIRDNDGIYGGHLKQFLANRGIEEVRTAPHSPWQNPFVERMIGTLRRELLDHVIVLKERHLMRLLSDFARYYHDSRVHMALDGNSPHPREVELPEKGRVVAVPHIGGLHHSYRRVA